MELIIEGTLSIIPLVIYPEIYLFPNEQWKLFSIPKGNKNYKIWLIFNKLFDETYILFNYSAKIKSFSNVPESCSLLTKFTKSKNKWRSFTA